MKSKRNRAKSKPSTPLFIGVGIIILACLAAGYFLFSELERVQYISQKERGCIESGGKVTYITCCHRTKDFPNTCLEGWCSCLGWEPGYKIKICDCGLGKCFDGEKCVDWEEYYSKVIGSK